MKIGLSTPLRIKTARHPLKGILGALVLIWGVLAAQPASAQAVGPSVTVNSTGDAPDLSAVDGVCDTGVLNSAGDPECTLRAAMEFANTNSDATDINFNVPASDPGHSGGVWSITPATEFPNISTPTLIHGETQPGWVDAGTHPAPVVVIDGAAVPVAQAGLFVVGGGAGSALRALSIVGFPGHAIQSNDDDLQVTDNYVGLRPDLTPDGNGGNGVFIRGRNSIVDRNVIGSNVNDGITLDSDVNGLEITRNLIGLDPNGVARGNANGIWTQGTGSIDIGSTNQADANIIANNTYHGIQVSDGQQVSIVGNSIYNHSLAGIILGAAFSVNDPGDGDTGPNGLLNYPVLSDSGLANEVSIEYDAVAADYRLEFFVNPSGPHSSGRGEGEVFVGSIDVSHPGGVANYSFSDPALTDSTWVSVTSTLLFGADIEKTSEFSPSFQMPGVRQFVVNSTGDADLEAAHGGQCRTGTLLPDSSLECTLRAALTLANLAPSRDEVSFDIPASDPGHSSGVWTIQVGSVLPGLNEPTVIDGSTQPGFTSNPVIEIDGQGITNAGLLLFGDDSLIQSLAIGGFSDGIRISTGARSQILGNHVGIDASGTQARPNSDDGIDVTSGTSAIEVGGPGPGEGNLVGNNADDGISFCCSGSTGSLVRGNVVGTDITQTANMANFDNAVSVTGSVSVTIGGDTAGSGNVLVNSAESGIEIIGPGPTADIRGNSIGINASAQPMANEQGVEVRDSVVLVQVGGTNPASGNTIAHNIQAAVEVSGTTQNVIVASNSIHSNGFGIALTPDSPNDPGDGDTGANDQLNRPVLSNVINGASSFQFLADLDVPPSNYRLELFDNLPGESQGRASLGSVALDTTGGTALFVRSLAGNVTGVLTATLTPCDAACTTFSIGTSPFSAAITPASPTVVVNSTNDTPDSNIGDGICSTGGTNTEGAPECTLRAAIEETSSASPIDTTHFNIPTSDPGHNSGTWTLQPASDLPSIDGSDLNLDARTQPGFVDVPIIELDGSLVISSTAGLYLRAENSGLRGFMVHSFSDDGIEVSGYFGIGDNNDVTDNWIGIDRNLNPAPNGDLGLLVTDGANDNSFERNVVVNATTAGVEIRNLGTDNNRFINNWIGELPDGTVMANSQQGIRILDLAAGTAIGEAGLGNVISNNGSTGLAVEGTTGAGTTIADNRIEDNAAAGININTATGLTIAGNIIQRNGSYGLALDGTTASQVGGPFAVDRNFIAGNALDGIILAGNAADLTIIGNSIGLSDLGFPLANRNGVNVTGTVTDINIGDPLTEAGNLIAFNTAAGIRVDELTQNAFFAANEIHSNGIGIELAPDTPNDPGDGDTGANHQLNRPVVYNVINGATDFDYNVTLDVAIGEYRIDLFDNGSAESQGRTYLGSDVLAKTSAVATTFVRSFTGQVSGALTATITPCDAGCVSPQLGTSPFSAPAQLLNSTVIVNSTSNGADNNPGDSLCDTGALNSQGDPECTLAAAITEANASTYVDAVSFAIPATDTGHNLGVWTITPTGPIPEVTEQAVVDARTQPGYAGSPIIEVDGQISTSGDGLRLETAGANSELYGFAVFNYTDAGIWSRANDSIMAFNYAGIRADGITPAANARGIDVWNGVDRVQIYSNVSSGNTDSGIGVFDAGTSVISIDGNFVGTDPTGSIPIPNGGHGIEVSGATNIDIGTISANVISGNGGNGILNSSSNYVTIENNIIGLNAAGDGVIPNGGDGVLVDGTSGFVNVGTAGGGNFIGGNVGNGIVIGSAGDTNTIRNNHIGTDPARTVDLGNGFSGVLIRPGAQDVYITYNDIANSGLDGIRTEPGVVSNVGVIRNETFNNVGLGIDIGGDGPTVNDPGDSDVGTNGLLNYPVVSDISPSGLNYTVDYQLDVPAGNYVVDFYTNPSGADPSGYGESEILLVSHVLFSHPGGLASYSTPAVSIPAGSAISGGIHLNGSGNAASEYGPVFNFTGISSVNSTGDLPDNNVGDGVCSTGQIISTGDAECSLRAAIEEANSPIGGERIVFNVLAADALFNLSGNNEFTIQPASPLPPLAQTVAIDGATQPGYVGQPLIELDGSLSSCPSATCTGLRIQAGTVAVTGMAINNWGVDGIHLAGDDASSIRNSFIGTDVTGVLAKPNLGAGIRAWSGTIGGGDLLGNTIAFNRGPGVVVEGSAPPTVGVTHNSIHSNYGIGIDLGDDGPTPNDLADADSGPNNLLNSLVITSVVEVAGSQIRVDGVIDVPAGNYMVQVFKNPLGGNANGDVQGELLEVSVPVTSAGAGAENASFTVPGVVGDRVTANITQDLAPLGWGATSEFSKAVTAVPGDVTQVRDSSGNRNDGQFRSGVSSADVTAGIIGNALDFDNTSDSISLPLLHSRSGELTASAWINPNSIADANLFSTEGPVGDQFSLGIQTAGPDGEAVATVVVNGTPVTATGGTIMAGNWYHLAATWDSSTLELFVDGVSVAASAAPGSLAVDSDAVAYIGSSPFHGTAFVGLIDEVRFLSTAVGSEWVLADYAYGSQAAQAGTYGAQETGAALPWTQSGTGGRSGSGAATAPTGSAGQSWLVADGVDEIGVEFDSWWYLTVDSGIDVGQGTRAAALGGAQNEVRVSSVSGFEISEFGPTGSNQIQAPTGGAYGTGWRRVRVRIDQTGAAIVAVDGVDLPGPVLFDNDPASGSIGFRSLALPNGEQWLVDDVLARRYVNPEPTSTVYNYERR